MCVRRDCPRALSPVKRGLLPTEFAMERQVGITSGQASCCTSATVTSALPPHASSSTSRARSARGACAERTRGRGGRCREIASARPRRPPPLWLYSKGSARRVSSSRRAESKEMYGATELRGCRSDHQISCAGQKKKTRAIGPQTQRRGGRRARPGHLHGWRGWARNRRSTSQGRVSTSARFGEVWAAQGGARAVDSRPRKRASHSRAPRRRDLRSHP